MREAWFAGIQVMAARMQAGSSKGLYLSAKGGHNGESHNHNDVGSFLVYCDGKPVVVDIGLGVYEKNTFNERRYEILQMQSLYHNLPAIWTEDGPCGSVRGENTRRRMSPGMRMTGARSCGWTSGMPILNQPELRAGSGALPLTACGSRWSLQMISG